MKTIIHGTAPDGDGVLWALKPRIIADGPSILVVGPDGVGKTTLVSHMSNMTEIPFFKCPSEKDIFRNGGRLSLAFDYTLAHFLSQTGYRFISDRSYPCEWVYSSVFGRETDMELLGMIDAAHAKLGTKILYVYSNEQPAEEDDIVPSDKYFDVLHKYNEFVEWTGCEVVKFDTTSMLLAYHRDEIDISEPMAKLALNKLGMDSL